MTIDEASAQLAKVGWGGLWTFKDTFNGKAWWLAVAFAKGDGEEGHGLTEPDALKELLSRVETRKRNPPGPQKAGEIIGGSTMKGLLVAVIVAVVLMLGGSAGAVNLPVEFLDLGPVVTFGGGSTVYPMGASLKIIPIEFEGPILDESFLETLENVGKYGLANAGADLLIPATFNADDVAWGASLPVVNGKVGVPLRLGAAVLNGEGLRGFLRVPITGQDGAASVALALAPVADRTDLMRQAYTGQPLSLPAPPEKPSLTISYAGGSAMAVYAVGFK